MHFSFSILNIILDNIGKIENEKCKIFIKYYLEIIKITNLGFKNDKKCAERGEKDELFFYNKSKNLLTTIGYEEYGQNKYNYNKKRRS